MLATIATLLTLVPVQPAQLEMSRSGEAGVLMVSQTVTKSDVLMDALDPATTGSTQRPTSISGYCSQIHDTAKEARATVLSLRLAAAEAQIDEKLLQLAAQTKLLREWTTKRDTLLNSINDTIINIFLSMPSDAAAAQFKELGPMKSAVIIARLPPKKASAFLAEMAAADAARITSVLASIVKKGGGQ